MKTNNNIRDIWKKKFSHVYCVSYAPYAERRKKLIEELKRVKIIDEDNLEDTSNPFFSFHYTVENPFEQLLLSHPDFVWPKHNMRFNKSALSLALGHYSVMREAISLDYLRILVIEDDIAFLRDLDELANIVDNMPMASDIVMFDKVTPSKDAWILDSENNKCGNDMYARLSPNDIMWTTSCFSLTTKAMSHICESQEKSFNVADYYTNCFYPSEDYKMLLVKNDLARVASIKNIACQRPSEETISDHGNTNSVYNQRGLYDCGINLEEYNL